MNVKISPSILASDFSILADELQSLSDAGADMVHIDVMDGRFVPNITLGPPVVKSLRKRTSLPFDVHLMISDPAFYIPAFIDAGADLICFHLESESDPKECVALCRQRGVKTAIALKPATPGEDVFGYLDDLDMVLVMTVEPGFGGQSFMEDQTDKIRLIREECIRRGLSTDIQVDGGITDVTAPLCVKAGANVLVAGSYVFKAADRADAVRKLKRAGR